jgi:hypothetical protein
MYGVRVKLSSPEVKSNTLINIFSLTELLGEEEPDVSLPLEVSEDTVEDDISSRYLVWIFKCFRTRELAN